MRPELRRTRQKGYTLIEIALTVVVAGLAVGAVHAGRELVAQARAKSLAGQFNSVRHAMQVYQDRFHALPGDDRLAPERLPGARVAPTAGNGVIDGAWNATAPTAEPVIFWEHLRLAGLAPPLEDSVPGDPRPRHLADGPLGVSSAMRAQRQVAGLGGSFQLCAGSVPGRLAMAVDRLLDDGDTASGSVRLVPDGSAVNSAAVASADVDEGAAYTVCLSF
jgi:prepilin-type N-terminal cleavage/methylation domain-containing protein